jgi:hypothetical protein
MSAKLGNLAILLWAIAAAPADLRGQSFEYSNAMPAMPSLPQPTIVAPPQPTRPMELPSAAAKTESRSPTADAFGLVPTTVFDLQENGPFEFAQQRSSGSTGTTDKSPGEQVPGPMLSPVPNPPLPPPPDGSVPYFSQVYEQPLDYSRLGPNFELPGIRVGWLSSVDVGLVKPFIHTGLNSGSLVLTGPTVFPGVVQLPVAQPGWTATPRVELGYRFEQGLGEIRAGFQMLSNDGSSTVLGIDPGGAASLSTRLRMDIADLAYASTIEWRPFPVACPSPLLMIPGRLGLNRYPENESTAQPAFVRWTFGARAANVFFDNRLTGPTLQERSMNNFSGAGIFARFELTKAMPWNPLGIYLKGEATGLLGKTTQSFAGTMAGGSGSAATRFNNGVPMVQFEAGLSYVPPWRCGCCRATAGYLFQQWWDLGDTADSIAELTLQGVFFRTELGY